MKLKVWGAAEQVTGSMNLLEVGDYKILVDCGLDYESGTRLEENIYFPFEPADIDVVILTHAHIDHSGNLPTLLRMGYLGQIICTPPTAGLTEILLLDSANVQIANSQSRPSKHKGKKPYKKRELPPVLYFHKHVMDTVEKIVTVTFHKPFKLRDDITLTFIPAGHLLGAASVVLEIQENGETKTIGFTGDIGRTNYPLVIDPELLPPLDYLVCESTYGGRFHVDKEQAEDILSRVIEDACIKNPGRLIIPAFSIGRTQALVYTLNKLFQDTRFANIKVFVDSPLASHATTIYRENKSSLNEEARAFSENRRSLFDFDNLHFVEDIHESQQLSNYYEPCIIISSAGMLEGGRIRDHLYHNLQNYYCTILFIGYSAKGTLGHRLLRGDPIVRLKDRELSVYAKILKTDILSGHADHNGLVKAITSQDPSDLKRVFLVHGDKSSMESLKDDLQSKGFSVAIPEKGQNFIL